MLAQVHEKCGTPVHIFNTELGDGIYCAECDEDLTYNDVVWDIVKSFRKCINMDIDDCQIFEIDRSLYIGVIKHDDGHYHVDVYTDRKQIEELDAYTNDD